jgi:hypothetical protein
MKKEDISVNYSSYSKVKSNPEHLKIKMEVNAVSSALGELCNERKKAAKKKNGEEKQYCC